MGMSFARALSYARNIPIVGVNHLEGHLYAHLLCGHSEEYPALTLLVSGGHSFLVLATAFGDYKVICSTRDDAAGEAFDKCASLMGLAYPGGPEIAKLALEGDSLVYELPTALIRDESSFSFSGLKTAVMRKAKELGDELKKREVLCSFAASVERAIVQSLLIKTQMALKRYSPKSLVLTGGVAANLSLRAELEGVAKQYSTSFAVADFKYCTDNAAMIALVGSRMHELGKGEVGDSVTFSVKPRWPLGEVK